jgi:hypothetical protein
MRYMPCIAEMYPLAVMPQMENSQKLNGKPKTTKLNQIPISMSFLGIL